MQARSEACPKMHCTYIQASAFRLRSPKLLFDTADFEQQLGLCWHARAVKEIALADKDWVESLTLEKAYDYITDVQLQHDNVNLISWGSTFKSQLVLSVGAHASGWPRVIVGADRYGNLVCRNRKCCTMPGIKRKCCHCKKVCEWQKAVDTELDGLEATGDDAARLDRLSALAAELEGYQLLSAAQTQFPAHAAGACHCPVSASKIQPDIVHPVMQGRAQGKLGILPVI